MTRTTILSSWGNKIRDQVVHLFDSSSEANAHPLADGSLGAIAGVPYQRRGGAWKLLQPVVVAGTVNSGTTGNIEFTWGTVTLPAGYTSALIVCCATFSGASGDRILNYLRRASDGIAVFQMNDAISPAGWAASAMTCVTALPAGGVVNATFATDYQHSVSVYGGANSSLAAVMFP